MKQINNSKTEIAFSRQVSPGSRRDFIRLVSTVLAGSALPLPVIGSMGPLEPEVSSIKEHFSLNKIYPLLEALLADEMKHEPGRSFKAHYTLFSLGYDLCRKEGKVTLNWDAGGRQKKCSCLVEREAFRTGLKSFYHLQSSHSSSGLDSLSEWKWNTKIAESFGADAFPLTEQSGGGKIRNGELQVLRDETNRPVALENIPLLKWSHWPALMDMNGNDSFRFDWIDEMEQVYTGHRLRYSGDALISTPQKNLSLCSFQQTGTGKVPTVYWLYNNIVVWVISGTEVYVLDDFNGKFLRYGTAQGRIQR